MEKNPTKTIEEMKAIIAEVYAAKEKDGLSSIKAACQKLGVNYNTFNGWLMKTKSNGKKNKKSKKRGPKAGKKKYWSRRKKSEPIIEHSLVPITAPTEQSNPFENNFDAMVQAAELLALMNARSMQALMGGRK